MVTLIASALVETLVKHMFQKTLNEFDKIEIDGAPSWYLQEIDDQMCTFAHSQGNLDSIEVAKQNTTIKMTKKINGLIDIVIYDNINKITKPKEKKMVELWKKDPHLDTFALKHIDFNKISYEEEINTTFVRACIPKKIIINYQKKRLTHIKKALLKYKSNNALNELNSELGNTPAPHNNSSDPFQELKDSL